MTRRITTLVAVAITLVLLVIGCSDDLVCPEPAPTPYFFGFVVQRLAGGDESTHAELVCTADPVPSGFAAYINGLALTVVGSPDGPGYLATLDADAVLWQPGTQCLLQTSTNYGDAGVTVVMPAATAVTAPAEISLGDTLKLTWRSAADVDYYEVSAVLVPEARASIRGARGSRDTLALSAPTRDTFAVFLPGSIVSAGVVSGCVVAVAGPFPESGTAGNVSGAGWGFFSLRCVDSDSSFDVTVSNVP